MINESMNGIDLMFETCETSFSPMNIDKGTLAMLSHVDFKNTDKVLDLGCGYGVVGIYAAKIIGKQNVVMSDVDRECVELSVKNAELNGVGGIPVFKSDGFANINEKDFTLILSNPPYHSDFSVPKHFIMVDEKTPLFRWEMNRTQRELYLPRLPPHKHIIYERYNSHPPRVAAVWRNPHIFC